MVLVLHGCRLEVALPLLPQGSPASQGPKRTPETQSLTAALAAAAAQVAASRALLPEAVLSPVQLAAFAAVASPHSGGVAERILGPVRAAAYGEDLLRALHRHNGDERSGLGGSGAAPTAAGGLAASVRGCGAALAVEGMTAAVGEASASVVQVRKRSRPLVSERTSKARAGAETVSQQEPNDSW